MDMDGVSKTRFSILTGIVFSVLILGIGSFVPNASAGSGCFDVDSGEFLLFDGDGFCWDIDKEDGEVDDGTEDAFDGYMQLFVNEDFFSPSSTDGTLSGRTITIGPETLDGCFEVTRKIFVPDNDGFARWLEIIKNICEVGPANGFGDVNINLGGNLGSDSSTILQASSSGDLLVTAADDWFISDESRIFPGPDPGSCSFPGGAGAGSAGGVKVQSDGFDPTVTTVISDAIAPVQPTTAFYVNCDSVEWSFDTNIPAGERIIIMTFVVQSPGPRDKADVDAQGDVDVANDLRYLKGHALEGMSAAELRD